MRVKDKVAVITGAGRGIGQATATLLAREGAKLVVGDIDQGCGQETTAIIKDSGGQAIFVRVDVSKKNDAENMINRTIDCYGRVDILFNNAGINIGGVLENMSEDDWSRVMDVNLKGTFLCSKYAVPHMIKDGGGSIVNSASVAGITGIIGDPSYSASKGAVITLTKNMALDYAPYNIRVNCVCPGQIATPLTQLKGESHRQQLERIAKNQPLKRAGKPEDVARAVLYLASDESSFVTGLSLIVDGGITLSSLSHLRGEDDF